MKTRSGETVSAQIGRMGAITGLTTADFSLPDGHAFNIKNDGNQPVTLKVILAGDDEGNYVETVFQPCWNPEIIKVVKMTSTVTNLKWGY